MTPAPLTTTLRRLLAVALSTCLLVGLTSCTSGDSDADRDPAPGPATAITIEPVSDTGTLTYGRTSVTAVGRPGQELRLGPARLSAPAASEFSSLLDHGIVAGTPVEVTAPGHRGRRFQLTRTYPVALPEGVAATWAFFDPTIGTWQAVPTTLSADRRTVTALVGHLSWWDDFVSGAQTAMDGFRDALTSAGSAIRDVADEIGRSVQYLNEQAQRMFTEAAEGLFWAVGALFDVRVDAPKCQGDVPAWVDDTIVVDDDKNLPIRWCVGHDPKHPELLVVKGRVNRGFGYGYSTTAAPAWTYNSTDKEGFFRKALSTIGSLDTTIAQAAYGLAFSGNLVGPGEEISFGFSEAEVRARDSSDEPLVELVLPDTLGFLFSVASQLVIKQTEMIVEGWVGTLLSFASCANDISASANPLGASRAVLTCIGQLDTQIAKATARVTLKVKGPGADPKEIGRNAGKAVGRASVILAIIGPVFSSFNYLAERNTDPHVRQLRVYPARPTGTQIVKVNPFSSTGRLRPGWTLTSYLSAPPIDCSPAGHVSASPSGLSPNTYLCGTTADNAYHCWAPPTYPGQLLCVFDPTKKEVFARRVLNVRPTPAPTDPSPLFLQLADGSTWWLRISGAWGSRADGYFPAYGCARGGRDTDCGSDVVLVKGELFDFSTPFWTVKVGPVGAPDEEFPPPRSMEVVKAYYMVSPFT